MNPVGEPSGLGRHVPGSDPGLSHSGWSEQCQQPGLIAFYELGQLAKLFVPAYWTVGEDRKQGGRGFVEVDCGEQGGAVGFGKPQTFGQQPHSGHPRRAAAAFQERHGLRA